MKGDDMNICNKNKLVSVGYCRSLFDSSLSEDAICEGMILTVSDKDEFVEICIFDGDANAFFNSTNSSPMTLGIDCKPVAKTTKNWDDSESQVLRLSPSRNYLAVDDIDSFKSRQIEVLSMSLDKAERKNEGLTRLAACAIVLCIYIAANNYLLL